MPASIIFVDPSVVNYQTLLEGANPDAQVVLLDTERSGIAQITETLAHSQDITAIHLLSHGSAGNLHLGSDILNTENLAKFSSQIKQWGASLTENADILLYGCDVAAGVTGANFIQNLSHITSADIAASNNLTGNPDLGGDWELEITTGAIEANIPFAQEAKKSYQHILANYNVTVATDDGTGGTAGTLSWAINQANITPGDDTITLTSNVRLTATPQILIDSNIAFIGGGFTISGDVNNNSSNDAGDVRPFFIKSGTVSFTNMTITGGRGQGGNGGTGSHGGGGAAGMGGGIFIYDGAVAIDNVTFANNRAVGGNGGGGNVGGSGAGAGGIGGDGGPGQPGGGFAGAGIGSIGNGNGQGVGVPGFGGGTTGANSGGFGGGGSGNNNTGPGTFGGSGQGGLGQGGGGAGLGGAILIRQGSLTLNNTTFNNNTATGGIGWQNGQAKGGAIFAMQSLTNTGGNQNQMPTALPIVSIYNSPSFSGNSAANHAGTATDNANFYAIINNAPTAANQTVSTNENTDYTFIPTNFNFSDADSDTLQTVKITQLPPLGALQLSGVNVTLNQEISFADINAGNLKFIPVADANGTNYDNFQFQVSDGKVYSLNAYTTTIDVTPVNDQPSFTTTGNPATVNEDAGAITISNWATFNPGPANEASQTATYIISNISNPGLFSVTPTVDSSGTLTYTPATNANGTSTFDVVVQDNGGTANSGVDTSSVQPFTITVTPVNDAPSFSNAGNQTLTTWTNTAQTVSGWANTFVFGPTDENSQTVADFLVSVTSGNTLFTTLPDIDNNGTLTYTPNGTPGTATVSVQLKDDGGIVNGGVDTSAPITFDIIIPPPTVSLSVNTTTGTEAGTTAITLTATAQGAVFGTQTLDLALTGTASNADFSGTIPTQITIADGSSTGQVTLTVANDLIAEDSETAIFTISNPSSGIQLGTTTAQTITITDNDTAGYLITPISGDTSEFGSLATFDIHLTSQPTADVTLNFTSGDTSEGTVTPSITFNSTNWNQYQTVTITGVDDLVADSDITYNITSTATSTDPKYNNNNPTDVTVTNTDNDIPGVTVIQTGGNTELTEGSITDTYTIQLNTLPIGNVQITATADAQTEISLDGVNFAASQTLTFTPTNGMTPQPVTVRAIDDTNPEDYHSGGITHTISNSADANYPTTMTVGNINPHITDNDISYTLTGSSTTVNEGNSGSQQITYNITRAGAINETSTVDFSFSGTAANTIDYNLVSVTGTGVTTTGSTINFPANSTSATMTVEVVGDQIDEDNETLAINLVNPTATGTPSVISSPVTTTITDDDTAGITVNPTAGLTTSETGGTSSFDVHLNTQPTANVTINLSSDNTAEGTIDKPSLVFTAANWNTPQTVTITGVDDLVDDGNIAYNIVTAAATSTDGKYNGINAADVAVTNTDNDTAGVTITQTGGTTQLTEGSITDTYTIALDTLPTGNVQITTTADAQTQVSLDGVNFAASQTLTFTSINGMTPQTVTVRAIDDNTTENLHSGTITNAITTSADANYPTTMALDGITGNITDNDISYSLTGGTPTITEGNSGSQQLTYNITRAGALNETSSVDFNFSGTATNIADYKLVSIAGTGVSTSGSSITFAPNAASATVTVEIVGEQIDEDDETLAINLVNPTATGTPSVIGSPVTTTISDDDTAGFTITPTSLTTTEAGGTSIFTVALNSQPTADVKINFSSSNTAEGIIDKPSLTFNSANWNTPQTVTITGVDDFGDDGDIPYNIITSVATSTDSKYNGINPVDVAVTNTDNDTAGVALSTTSIAAYEGGAGGSYTAVLTSKPTAPVTINFGGGRQINRIAALTFDSNNWNVPQPVIITAIDDNIAQGLQTETLSHTVTSGDAKYNGVNVGTVAVSITDNDTAAAPVVQPLGRMDVMENGGEDVYELFLTTQPTATVNVAIVTDGQTTANVPYLTFTTDDWNHPQLVRVSAVDDNVVEGFHTSNISFVASSADGFYQGLPISGIVANIADNDNVGLVESLPTPASMVGTGVDDKIVGSAGDDVINARNGNNRLDGGAGNDVMLGGNGADYITGGAGLDQILSGNGEDYLSGGDGEDVMLAGTGSDRLYGGAGNDKLFGEQGNDYLCGDAGVDTLTGGLGRDAFAIGNGLGGMTVEMADVITDFVQGEDVIDLIPGLGFGDLSLVQNGADTVIQNVVTSEFLAAVTGVNAASLSAVDFV